jgi:hypothetical protein
MIRISKEGTTHDISYWNTQLLSKHTGAIFNRNKPNLPFTVNGWLIEEIADPPVVPTLEQVKNSKIGELQIAFENSKNDIVTAETYTWYKNRDKTQLQYEAIQLAELKSETTVNLIDSINSVRNLTIAQAKNVIVAAADGYAQNYWNLQTKLAACAAASDIAAVEAITW